MSYELVWEPSGVVMRLSGFVSNAELMRARGDVDGNERFDELRHVICDFRTSTGGSIDVDDVDELAAMDLAASRTNRDIRIAVVAAQTQAQVIELANHYARSKMNVYPTRTFSSEAEARVWLGAFCMHTV